jgi:hypothetical protein
MLQKSGLLGAAARNLLFCSLVAAALSAPGSLSLARESSSGEWQTKAQLVWDSSEQKLVRRTFRVWDPHPELGLEFSWEQQSGATTDPTGTVAGSGILIWRAKGSASYDRKAVHSEYQGEMQDGRPNGAGRFSTQTGLSYDGSWQDGLMHGRGSIKFPNGDEYDGEFTAGALHGIGRYAAADGSVFEGGFRDGQRDGTGLLTLANGVSYRSIWMNGVETAQSLANRDAELAGSKNRGAEYLMAQAASRVTLSAYIDRKKNADFKKQDESFASFMYDQVNGPGVINIRLASKEIMDLWKGNGVIKRVEELFDTGQFAPVFLVIDISNEGAQSAQIARGYLDVEQSVTDLQPFLNIMSDYDSRCGGSDKFDPSYRFINSGWGGVKNAKVTYSFGRTPNPAASFVEDIGSFDEGQPASVVDGLQKSGVNVQRLRTGGFKCGSLAQIPACTAQLQRSGVLSKIAADAVFVQHTHVLMRVSGRINYDWTDSAGSLQQRQSPMLLEIPMLQFKIPEVAECGAPGPVERDLKPLQLSLDRKNYRIALDYSGNLAPRQNRRFGLTLSAQKSSQHQFKITLELADGRTVSTPRFDLLYFKPNLRPPADPPDPSTPGKN